METSNPEQLLLEILARKKTANRIAKSLGGDDCRIFEPMSLADPRLRPPEMGFLLCVTWLYVLYYEAGKIGVAFLLHHVRDSGAGDGPAHEAHYGLVRDLRTYFQHQLFEQSDHDRAVRERCETWLRRSCGSVAPGNGSEWISCRDTLLVDAVSFAGALVDAIRGIEGSESADTIITELQTRIRRHHPPHQFDRIIDEVKVDIGRDFLDTLPFRKRHYDRWIQRLKGLKAGYDFDFEARRLVEYTLLTDVAAVLPITGTDVMERFELGPGPEVGELLQRAKELYENEACARAELLDRLAEDRETA